MDRFSFILDPSDPAMNRLDDTFDFLRGTRYVANDRNNSEAFEIDQFLCFLGCPTDHFLPI